MINEPVIVGCGTIGATLALHFAKEKIVSKLKVYDFDTVSYYTVDPIYPFTKMENGIPKVQTIQFQCKKLNPDLMIFAEQKKITEPFDTSEFVIDCRDCKRPIIDSKIRLSLDGHLLYIDSFAHQHESKNYHHYIYPRNPDYIDSAIKIITEYLINDKYMYHDLRLYNIMNGEEYILVKEK